jgi:tetratricopeptide (TPR) repeat protein
MKLNVAAGALALVMISAFATPLMGQTTGDAVADIGATTGDGAVADIGATTGADADIGSVTAAAATGGAVSDIPPELSESYSYSPWYSVVTGPMPYSMATAFNYQSLGLAQAIAPADVFALDGLLYITCSATNAVYVVDADMNVVSIISEAKGSPRQALNAPEGVFVKGGDIYIADTQNNRIVVVDIEGNLKREYSDPGINVLGERVVFFPSKITVDNTGRIYVIGRNINRGVIELSSSGEFRAFIGAPKVKVTMADVFRRMFMTEEQIKRSERFIPTEYNNIAIDAAGFIYGTIGSVDAASIRQAARSEASETPDNARPVVKLSPAGNDVLTRRGNVPIIGELSFTRGDHSYICDVDIRSDGIYSILDQKHGKIFTYDMYGNLLYVFGALGRQFGTFSSPSALCYMGENIVVADRISGYVSIFKPTEYGRSLNAAVRLDYEGKFEEAANLWYELARQNSNLYLAYTGIGKMYYRDKDFDKAMEYFKTAYDYSYYDEANYKRRKTVITKYFPVVFVIVVFACIALWVRGYVIKKKRHLMEESFDAE